MWPWASTTTRRATTVAWRGAAGLTLLCALGAPRAWARPDVPGSDLFTFNTGDVVETFDSEHFRIHYTTAGEHQVPAGDGDGDGTPDHVQALADIYEAALSTYLGLGFRAPVSDENVANNGGDGRFDVYLVDFARNADGAYRAERCEGAICSGYMVQENDFIGYGYPSVAVANKTVASHELFHAIQAAYDVDQGAVYSEGTAVWASERFDASLRDLEGFAFGYLDNAATPLDSGRGGPVDSFTYGAGIFFEYLTERFSGELVHAIVEATADDVDEDAYWFDALSDLLVAEGSTFADAFTEFSTWTLMTGRRADPGRSFRNGSQMALRDGLEKSLPVDEGAFIVFTASSRMLQVNTNGVDDLFVALGGDATAVDGIRVVIATVAGGSVVDVVAVDDATADDPAVIDVAGASEALIVVVNTRQSGSSSRPQLCVGDADAVAACANDSVADDDDDDTGAGDVSLGGGCSSASARVWSPLVWLAVVVMGRRRRST